MWTEGLRRVILYTVDRGWGEGTKTGEDPEDVDGSHTLLEDWGVEPRTSEDRRNLTSSLFFEDGVEGGWTHLRTDGRLRSVMSLYKRGFVETT